ncbi:hypothetical protein EXIGLDRAFT_775751 [Exidia glandulosa HHB12029]|uniref:Uncharacterized protein n=1 Tax=Exidia glandulosa HHB12029 TaxID=1314781 RepID=A0A165DSI0_EXIGL|nr:hypothetical protein EXIGLDRAFT_775751 [Exidia glandulosa HHB12029]
MASQPASVADYNRPGSPPFHPANDDLRSRASRTREEYVELHRQLTVALETDTPSSYEIFDRRWTDLVNVMDDRDYWEARCLRYHSRYLTEVRRTRDYKALVIAFRRENTRLRESIKELRQEISVLRAELDEQFQYHTIVDLESEVLDDLSSVCAVRKVNIFEDEGPALRANRQVS